MIHPHSIQQILDTVPIDDLVGDYVKLKRSGSRFKGNCPFHDEKTPSFVVTPSLNIYKCFGCQKGGNSIQFLMEMEQMTFVEAARDLAKRYGITLMESEGPKGEEALEQQRQKESLQALNEFALTFFENQLQNTEEGQTVALPYFKERGYTTETINEWRLGYSPQSWEAFYNHAKKAGYSDELLLNAGLIKKRDSDGKIYDLFRNRVIFPLVSVSGRVVGFAGRIMGKVDKAPKYVNSPETSLYKKSDFLFATDKAKNAIRAEDYSLLMEGYTDVMTLHQAGIKNAVASSGTALTPGQIKLIKRFSENATAVYDGDKAGIKASLRGVDLLLEGGLNVRVVTMPEGEDPDSYCKQLGSEGFKEFLKNNEQNFIVFKANMLFEEASSDPIKRSEALRDILQSISLINDGLKRDALLQELESISQTDVDLLRAEVSKILHKKTRTRERKVLREVDNLISDASKLANQGSSIVEYALNDKHQEKAILEFILRFGGMEFDEENRIIDFVIEEFEQDQVIKFKDPTYTKIMERLMEIHSERPEWVTIEELIADRTMEISKFAADILSEEYELSEAFEKNMISVTTRSENYKKEIYDLFLHLRRTKIEELIIEHQKMLGDEEYDETEVLDFLNELIRKKSEIASKIGAVVTRI